VNLVVCRPGRFCTEEGPSSADFGSAAMDEPPQLLPTVGSDPAARLAWPPKDGFRQVPPKVSGRRIRLSKVRHGNRTGRVGGGR